MPAVIAMIVSLMPPKSYTSVVKILTPEVASGGLITATSLGAITGINLRGAGVSSQAIMAILQSAMMASDVVRKFKIKELYKFKERDDAVKYLMEKMTSISLGENEGTISTSVTSIDPKLSRDIIVFTPNCISYVYLRHSSDRNAPVYGVLCDKEGRA